MQEMDSSISLPRTIAGCGAWTPPRSEVAVMHDCQSSSTDLDAVDNLTVHPQSGDVYIAEDGGNMELCVLGVVNGVHQAAAFMRLPGQSSSEVTGTSFSPDGSRLYVSSQRGTDGTNGITYEISGPFRSLAQGPGPRVSVLYCSADSYVREQLCISELWHPVSDGHQLQHK